MIPVTFKMVLHAVIFSAFFGASFSVLYGVLKAVPRLFSALLRKMGRRAAASKWQSLAGNVFDFFFGVTVGTCYLLTLYCFTDGVFFAASLFSLLLSFLAVRRIAARFFVKRRRRRE